MEPKLDLSPPIPSKEKPGISIISAAINSVKKSPITSAGVAIPHPENVESFTLSYSLPSRFPARSLVMFVDVTSQSPSSPSTSFVLRKKENEEGIEAQRTRQFAQQHPLAAAVCAEYLPEVYTIDTSGWTAVERVKGIEAEQLTALFGNDEFNRIYAKAAVGLLIKAKKAGLTLSDIGFVTGHNVLADQKNGTIRLIEPQHLIPSREEVSIVRQLAPFVFRELHGGTNHWSTFLYSNEDSKENIDHSLERRFLFEFMKQISTIEGWETMTTEAEIGNDDEYLCTKDPNHRSLGFLRRRDIEEEFLKTNTVVKEFTPQFIKTIKSNDFKTFDDIVRGNNKFRLLKAIPKKILKSFHLMTTSLIHS